MSEFLDCSAQPQGQSPTAACALNESFFASSFGNEKTSSHVSALTRSPGKIPTTVLLSPPERSPHRQTRTQQTERFHFVAGVCLVASWVPHYHLVDSFSPISDDFAAMHTNMLELIQPSRVRVSSHRPHAVTSHAHTRLHVPGVIVSVAVDTPLEHRHRIIPLLKSTFSSSLPSVTNSVPEALNPVSNIQVRGPLFEYSRMTPAVMMPGRDGVPVLVRSSTQGHKGAAGDVCGVSTNRSRGIHAPVPLLPASSL